ncbi:MAG: hypothetical protein ACREJC_13630 [Tepidisphaeraceae bacterium]
MPHSRVWLPMPQARRAGFLFAMIVCTMLTPMSRAASLPPTVRTAPDASIHRAEITKFIKAQIAQLTNPAPPTQSGARDAIVGETLPGGGVTPSASFLDIYSEILNDELVPLAGNPELRVRLGAAIVAARVAERASASSQLQRAVMAFMNDKNEAVVLWGLKGARFIMKPVLNNPASPQLIPVVLKTGTRFLTGPVTQASYDALNVDPATIPASATAAAIGATQDLLAARVAEYADSIPADPIVDTQATLNLTAARWFNPQTAPQRLRTAQLLSDLSGSAAAKIPQAEPEERKTLAIMIKRVASAVSAMGILLNNTKLQDDVKEARAISENMSADDIVNRAKTIYPALHSVYGGLTPPPMIEASATPSTTNSASQR